jgi:hypothetical protein
VGRAELTVPGMTLGTAAVAPLFGHVGHVAALTVDA